MTEQEIEILESAMLWIRADAEDSDDSSARREGNRIADALGEIIQKHHAVQEPDYREDHMGRTF